MSILEVLRSNHGFDEPEKWVKFAQRERFERVSARPILCCPDCGRTSVGVLGQYVHFSTLMRLRVCMCGLIWSDAAIDPAVLARYWETAYKDEDYFQHRRWNIFQQLAGLIDQNTPQNGRVIDIGGSKGHLMHETRRRRPDLAVAVTDPSTESVAHCRNHFGIAATAGSLLQVTGHYDTAVLSDVLYYEDDIRAAWDALARVANTVILRGPNKLGWIRAHRSSDPLQTSVPHFNPEHRFILSREYIERGLRRAGFTSVTTVPAVALGALTSPLVDSCSKLAYRLTGAIKSPSMITIARRA